MHCYIFTWIVSNFLYWALKLTLFGKGWIYINLFADKSIIQQFNSLPTSNYSLEPQIMEPIHFFIEDLQVNPLIKQQAQELIFDSIPIKLSFRNQSLSFKDYEPHFETYKQRCNHAGTALLRRYFNYLSPDGFSKDFSKFAMDLLDEYPIFMLEFSGKYNAGTIHTDAVIDSLVGCYNFYHIKKGAKKVILVPSNHIEYIELEAAPTAFFPEGLTDPADISALQYVPEYYEFEIHEGEFILFNNCDNLHKFDNIDVDKYGYYPVAYSLRFSNRKRSPLHIYKNNYQMTIMDNAHILAGVGTDQIVNGLSSDPVIQTFRII